MNENLIVSQITNVIEGITEGNHHAVKSILNDLKKEDIPSDDLKKLYEAVAVLARKQEEAGEFILSLSHGELDLDPPHHNHFIAPFKELHSNLRHLVWQVGQFAAGDYNQKVEFSGVFTESFQHLAQSLKDKETIQKALRESEALYRVTLDASPDGIILSDIHGHITMASPSAIQLLGGENEQDLLGEKFLRFIIPDDWDRLKADIEKLIQGSKIQANEYRGKRLDGSLFHTEITGDLIKDEFDNTRGIIFDWRDISDRNRAELKLQESEQRYRLLVETANEGVLVAQGNSLRFVNPMMLEITGYTEDELHSKPFLDFIHPDDRELVQSNYVKRLSYDPVEPRYQFRIFTRDKEIKWVEVSGAAIDWDGSLATFNFMTDITERKKTEQELERKNAELLNLNAEKDKLFSILAHDLRSPFSSFMKYTEIMAEDLYEMCIQEIQDMAVEMKESAINLNSLLENLLEWSRMESGLISFAPSSFLLKPKIAESMALVIQAANKKEIQIQYDIPDDLLVDADENMLKLIVRNLGYNAVKFTFRGGTITLKAKPVNSHSVEISVKDSGIGIGSEGIGNLFSLNKRTSRTGTEGELSTGLGLILCKEFVEKNGGKIWVESEVGKGSIFQFTIPRPMESAQNTLKAQ